MKLPSGSTSVAVLAAILILGSAWTYRMAIAPGSATGSKQLTSASAPSPDEIIVLRLEKDGQCRLNGIVTENSRLPALLREHAARHENSALLIEVHTSLTSGALTEAMDMVNRCGIKRTAVKPFLN